MKLALGKVVIVGNQIEYLQRVQVTSSTPSSALGPLAATPQSLNFASLNGVTNGAAQTITLTNNGSTPLTSVTPTLGTSKDFNFTPSTCPSPLTQTDHCTLSVTYNPSPTAGADPRTATLQVSYSPGSTPLSIPLSGAASNTVYFSRRLALSHFRRQRLPQIDNHQFQDNNHNLLFSGCGAQHYTCAVQGHA